jgi:uncharacterized protein (TIGR04255 family)
LPIEATAGRLEGTRGRVPMPFPESPRVIYDRNPLEEVICQLKFPTILRIESEPPAAFQEALRREYPLLNENPAAVPDLPPGLSKIVAAELGGLVGARTYQFASADNLWRVTLRRDFVALSTRAYRRWEEFRARMQAASSALVSQYEPAFFARVGLRYRDVIKPSALGLSQVVWSDLLQPHILGELSSRDVGPSIRHAARDVLVALGGADRQVRIRHGLGLTNGGRELCYVIDSDFYCEGRTEVRDVYEILDFFNRQAGRLFRWCITPRLHELLGPQPA